MREAAAADRQLSQRRSVAVATAVEDAPEEELSRVGWPLTVLRLALSPGQHPWRRGFRVRRKGPILAVAAALLLLLFFAASGCSSTPRQSLLQTASAAAEGEGARCDTMLVSQELQIPPQGELSDLRVVLQDLPEVVGPLRVLVRRPRFPARLELDAEGAPDFDKVLDVPARRQFTLVLTRGRGASDDWPRQVCRSCRVDVELTGLFGARQALRAFFTRAMLEAGAVEGAFARQSAERPERPTPALRAMADALSAEASRCHVPLAPALSGLLSALSQLDAARARFYAAQSPEVPDAQALLRAWESANASLDALPALQSEARASGWPGSLRPRSAGRLRQAAAHLELWSQIAGLPAEERNAAARWAALALAPDPAALEARAAGLPPIRDLADAEARLAWVDPPAGAPLQIPGAAAGATLTVAEWRSPPSGRRCIGEVGAVPVRDREAESRAVAAFFGADARQRLRIGGASDLPAARETLRRARGLLCEPLVADVSPLFSGLEQKELGAVHERLEAIYADADPRRQNDEIARAVAARTSELFCKLFDPSTIERRVTSVVGYKIFVEGGTRVLDFLPGPLFCDHRGVPAREIRRRLREAYRAALDRHAAADRLCAVRGGKCPEEIAASVRRLFSLQRPELAAPAPPESRALDFPPPFGFSDEWVHKLDRCAREACDALLRLRDDAPPGQFEGAVCAPPAEGSVQQQEVALDRPEAPATVTLSSCEAHAGVRLTLRPGPAAGTLVSIASSHPFRYGSENVLRQGRHPQLGRIFERVADLTDPGDVSRRGDGAVEVALTPTVANQVFWFFTLRRRDY
jgi:hypothetical protein